MSSIEWTDKTWNPVVGCSRVSKGCEHCYAEGVAHRGMSPQHRGLTVLGQSGKGPRWNGTVRLVESALAKPLRWRDASKRLARPLRVFVNSMSDLFHESLTNEQIAAVFAVMAACPHTFQVLTKRPERAREWFAWGAEDDWHAVRVVAADALCLREQWCHAGEDDWTFPLANVWLGVSVEDQATADERIPLLLDTPAAIRFVSYEPALGPVDFSTCMPVWQCPKHGTAVSSFSHSEDGTILCDDCGLPKVDGSGLDWVIVGGESGPGARPFDLAWARSTVEACRAAGVRAFFKQAGARPMLDGAPLKLRHRKGADLSELPADLNVREFPDA